MKREQCIVAVSLYFFAYFFSILSPFVWSSDVWIPIVWMCGGGSLFCFCPGWLCVTKNYKSERMFIFDCRRRIITYKRRYYILNGCSLTSTKGDFDNFQSVRYEVTTSTSTDDDGNVTTHDHHWIIWNFGNGDNKMSESSASSRVVAEINDFWARYKHQLVGQSDTSPI